MKKILIICSALLLMTSVAEARGPHGRHHGRHHYRHGYSHVMVRPAPIIYIDDYYSRPTNCERVYLDGKYPTMNVNCTEYYSRPMGASSIYYGNRNLSIGVSNYW